MTITAADLPPFTNEPLLELRRPGPRAALGTALRELDARLPLRAPVTIDGTAHADTPGTSVDPSAPARIVALAGDATAADADAAITAARAAFPAWSARSAPERPGVMLAAAPRRRDPREDRTDLRERETDKRCD
jgi:delta 1-pyrroline-5-carboxylate dehydrogenase